MSTAQDIVDRVWVGRHSLRELHIDPDLKNVEIVLSVDAHMQLMAARGNLELRGVIQPDHEAPLGIRIFGLPVLRDPTFADHEIRFRSEVSV